MHAAQGLFIPVTSAVALRRAVYAYLTVYLGLYVKLYLFSRKALQNVIGSSVSDFICSSMLSEGEEINSSHLAFAFL
jgi:hypothetical protein